MLLYSVSVCKMLSRKFGFDGFRRGSRGGVGGIFKIYISENNISSFSALSGVFLYAHFKILRLASLAGYYPRATRCGGDIVTLLWFRPCVRVSVRVSVTLRPCEQDTNWTVVCLFIKLGRYIHYDERMISIDFEGQRSKVKVTIDIYVISLWTW